MRPRGDAGAEDACAYERVLDARLVASVVATGLLSFAGVIVETSMNIAFPSLMEEFGVEMAAVQWTTTGYLLVLSSIIPISAFLKKRFTIRGLFTVAIVLFLSGTLLCAAAPRFAVLVLGRLVQGVGTGLALPLMFNIVIEQAPYDRMGLMMGLATLITALGPALGPSLGGLVISVWGWRMIFLVLVPVLVVAFALGVPSIRQACPTQRVRFSVVQFLLLAAAFSCLVFAVNSASDAGWLSVRVLGLLAAAVVLLALFAVAARRSSAPLIHVQIFANPAFTLSVVYVVLFQGISLATSYLIPNYAQFVSGFDEFAAGCLMLPGCIIGAVMMPLCGRILDKLGPKRPITLGAASQLLSTTLLMTLGVRTHTVLLAFYNMFISIGQGFSMSNSITHGLSFLPEQLKADGNATFNTLQQLGGAIGTAVAASFVSSAQAASSDIALATIAGAQHTFTLLFGVSIVCCLCVFGVFVCRARQQRGGADVDGPSL